MTVDHMAKIYEMAARHNQAMYVPIYRLFSRSPLPERVIRDGEYLAGRIVKPTSL